MNILYLTNHLNIGGITSYVITLARGMKQRGHNVYVASSGGQLVSRFVAEGVNYIPIPIRTKKEISPKILICLFKLSGLIKKYNIDIVHSNSRTTQILGALLARFTGVTHIFTCHGFFRRRVLRKIFPCWGQRNIAISKQVKEHLMRDLGAKEKNIRVVHNGIDVDGAAVMSPELRVRRKKILGLADAPVVGIVARLSDVKGHKYLIGAMKEVLEKIPDAQLLVVGEGKIKEGLISLTDSLGMAKSVFFIPEVNNTQEVLSIMDLFVMPSLKEGLGLALMEAMACGLAVIGSDVGGIKSLIQHGHNGLLVKPADTKELASAILALLKDSRKRESLGKEARTFIAHNFSQRGMVLETEKAYLESLKPALYCQATMNRVRKRKRFFVALSLITLSILLLLGFIRRQYVVPILMYHSIDLHAAPSNRLLVSAGTFERQMRFLKKHRYNVLPLEELANLIGEKKKIPPRTLAITFDDGRKDNYIYAFPILKKYNLPATIFIIVNEVGRPDNDRLGWGEIKEMQGGGLITFGSHTLTHKYLEEIKNEKELIKEIFDSKRILEEKLNTKVNIFSYPGGRFTASIRQMVIDAGYKLAVATNPGKSSPSNDIFALKRLRISENADNLFIFWVEASGFYTFLKEHRHK